MEKQWWADQTDKYPHHNFDSWTASELAAAGVSPAVIRSWARLRLQDAFSAPPPVCRACGGRPETAQHLIELCEPMQDPLEAVASKLAVQLPARHTRLQWLMGAAPRQFMTAAASITYELEELLKQ